VKSLNIMSVLLKAANDLKLNSYWVKGFRKRLVQSLNDYVKAAVTGSG
jgi:hypothetical protein